MESDTTVRLGNLHQEGSHATVDRREEASYRKGYKAGAAMKYRHTPKPETPIEGPIQPAWGWPSPSQTPLTVGDFPAPPTVYGDSLPVKESLTSEK